MEVAHPRAGDAPLPSAVTVDGTDYRIADDGVVECPEAVAERVAAAWARRFDVDGGADALLVGDEAGDGEEHECGDTKTDGEPCTRTVDSADKRCWQHTED